ncbi:MAG TPA: 30S ribosome-binding factor RbfA [Solirubrobacteraceae bacterium]|jgi:ribosome-binding factor A
MAAERMRRVNEAIRQVIADALAGELADPRLGFVTVTDVKTSPDLRSARVYVSVLGEGDTRADSLVALGSAHGVLQARIATQLGLKRTPRLEFAYDATTDRALRVESLLREGNA